MINFVLIAVCILAGMLFRKAKTLPADAHKGINAFLIYIALPAVSFKFLPNITWSRELLLPAISPVIVWVGSWLWIKGYNQKSRLDKATAGGLRLTTGLSNTSFVGFPLIVAYFTEKELGIAIICDQVTFALLSTAGVIVAIKASGRHSLTTWSIVKKLLRFPPFLGCVLALTIPHFLDITFFNPLFDKLAVTVAPLALFSIGLQLNFAGWRNEFKKVSMALIYKLILAPILVLAAATIFHVKGTIAQISIFEAAMPTLLTAGIVTEEYGLNVRLSNIVIGISIIAALATTAVWFLIIRTF